MEESPANLHTSFPTWRRASSRSLNPDLEVAEAVHRCIAKMMRQLPALSRATSDEDSLSNDEDLPVPRRICKNLKSGMDRTCATTVSNNVTWPHEVVFTSDGKPASY